MKRELKKYGLRSSTRVGTRKDVLQIVQISHQGVNTHYCYIRFSEAFVDFVGGKLPQGVGPMNPAFLSVDKEASGIWQVYAGYWNRLESSRILLWSTPSMPGWLKFHKLKKVKNVDPSPQGSAGPESGHTTDASATSA